MIEAVHVRSRLVGIQRPHIWYRGGRYYRPWCCRMPITGAIGSGWKADQAYFQAYWNDVFGRLGSGLGPPPWIRPT